ncbi:MAG: 3' terminal RNA ribose 2'-O-methyltransferase Hen1 [bacterium]|nr:3' terminal RNA ribose 2'-O-methyltransferase Hen1 [bacterium]
MLLTLTTTHKPATDLGYLLHKHPDRIQTFTLSFGQAHVFYPEATPDRCTAALLLDIDPIGLVRNRRLPPGSAFALQQYVNDRPYVASSFLSVAIARIFGTALNGRCKDRPDLIDTPLPLSIRLPVLPVREGKDFLHRLFEPLGYTVSASPQPLDPHFPDWSESPYFAVELTGTQRLCDLLTHLYVLVPVLDNDKHYWVGDDEVAKLLKRGEGWLHTHPEREQITAGYLKHQRTLIGDALARLEEHGSPIDTRAQDQETTAETSMGLNQQRLQAVATALKNSGATRVLDLGCGDGKLLPLLLQESQFTDIVGLEVAHSALEKASRRLRLDTMPDRQRRRIQLIHGSLLYRDQRLSGYDAAALAEVIEHLDPSRLPVFERVLFEYAQPQTVVITTPNRDYNKKWPTLPAGDVRHPDHRFEWTRSEFQSWADRVCKKHGYTVRYLPVGPEDPLLGPPTQMGVFTR